MKVFSKLSQQPRLSVPYNPQGIAAIARLGFGRGPDAIPGSIRAVVIQALNTMLWCRPWSHIRKKLLKGLPVQQNATPTIAGITGRTGRLAPLFHMRPDAIFRAPAFSMGSTPQRKVLGEETSAASGFVLPKLVRPHQRHPTTVAQAIPLRTASCGIAATMEDNQTTITSTAQINAGNHTTSSTQEKGDCWVFSME